MGMRPIDADTLKDNFPNARADIFENCRNCTCLDNEQINQIIDSAPTIDSWISVKDMKPPSIVEPCYRNAFRPVFLYTKKDDSVYVGWYLGKDYKGIDCYISRTAMTSYQHITKKITHWMPMPELPKEEKTN